MPGRPESGRWLLWRQRRRRWSRPLTRPRQRTVLAGRGPCAWQDEEAVVFQLDVLLEDLLDTVPGVEPALGRLLAENGDAAHRDPRGRQDRSIDHRRPP